MGSRSGHASRAYISDGMSCQYLQEQHMTNILARTWSFWGFLVLWTGTCRIIDIGPSGARGEFSPGECWVIAVVAFCRGS